MSDHSTERRTSSIGQPSARQSIPRPSSSIQSGPGDQKKKKKAVTFGTLPETVHRQATPPRTGCANQLDHMDQQTYGSEISSEGSKTEPGSGTDSARSLDNGRGPQDMVCRRADDSFAHSKLLLTANNADSYTLEMVLSESRG